MSRNSEWLWRESDGLPLDDEYIPPNLRKPPINLADEVNAVLKEFNLHIRTDGTLLSRLAKDWNSIVGTDWVSRISPSRYTKPTLYLAVTASRDLLPARTELLPKIRHSLLAYSTPESPIRQTRILLTQAE